MAKKARNTTRSGTMQPGPAVQVRRERTAVQTSCREQRLKFLFGRWSHTKAELALQRLKIRAHSDRGAPSIGKVPLRWNLAHIYTQPLAPTLLQHFTPSDQHPTAPNITWSTLRQVHVAHEEAEEERRADGKCSWRPAALCSDMVEDLWDGSAERAHDSFRTVSLLLHIVRQLVFAQLRQHPLKAWPAVIHTCLRTQLSPEKRQKQLVDGRERRRLRREGLGPDRRTTRRWPAHRTRCRWERGQECEPRHRAHEQHAALVRAGSGGIYHLARSLPMLSSLTSEARKGA
eukprot:scaffold141301_cov30-Tisochrysis_lutea.AAC.7